MQAVNVPHGRSQTVSGWSPLSSMISLKFPPYTLIVMLLSSNAVHRRSIWLVVSQLTTGVGGAQHQVSGNSTISELHLNSNGWQRRYRQAIDDLIGYANSALCDHFEVLVFTSTAEYSVPRKECRWSVLDLWIKSVHKGSDVVGCSSNQWGRQWLCPQARDATRIFDERRFANGLHPASGGWYWICDWYKSQKDEANLLMAVPTR